jgi:hypothetical protein
MRYAKVRGKRSTVEAYLPSNYRVGLESFLPDGRSDLLIEGEDEAGWTLDEYVIPRLASGLMFAKEYATREEAAEATSAAMN